ncbi:porin family protein [Parapedobacter soli]|uniref:porin family protein n=1 Tax=Parapedobacter soli TaxID=416955 RepID=UPI0021C91B22|nr:porin family protein [Parapedobacter soli]
MKRSITLLVFALLVGGGYAFGQSASGVNISYGIKAGVNFASTDEKGDEPLDTEFKQRPMVSFHIGGHVDFAFSEAFSLQSGLVLNGKGSRETWSGEDGFDGDEVRWEGSFRESIIYLEIPVNAVYRTGHFFVGAGPYVGYALSGKWKEKYTEDFGDGIVETDEESGKVIFSGESAFRKRPDFGINFLAGYQLIDQWNLGIGYGLGLNNIYRGDGWTTKNRVISVSVGYNF